MSGSLRLETAQGRMDNVERANMRLKKILTQIEKPGDLQSIANHPVFLRMNDNFHVMMTGI